MRYLLQCVVAGGVIFGSTSLLAQTTQTPATSKDPVKTTTPQHADRGSAGAITMEEYQTLLSEYQKTYPDKTFQDMKKEEFETYLTTELARLRKQRAEEAQQKKAEEKAAEQKAAEPK